MCENVTVNNFFLTSKDLKKKSRQIRATSRGLNPGEKFDQAVTPCPDRLATFGWLCVHTMEGERENEKKSIGTEFYYIGMTAKKRKISLPANYISVWMIFLPPPTHICFGPFEFSVLRELGYHFHFIASVAYRMKERKKWLGRNLTKILRINFWARGGRWNGPGFHTHVGSRGRMTCFSSTSSSSAFGRLQLLFGCKWLLFSLVRHSKWMLRDTWALVWVWTDSSERMEMAEC